MIRHESKYRTSRALFYGLALLFVVPACRDAETLGELQGPGLAPDLQTAPAQFRLVGRWDLSLPDGPRASWAGSAVVASFRGTRVSVRLKTHSTLAYRGPSGHYYIAIIDGGPPVRFAGKAGPAAEYVLAEGLRSGSHTVALSLETEGSYGNTQFLGFDFGEGEALPPPAPATRRVELVGDSISCGYGNIGEQSFANAGNHYNPPNVCKFSTATESNYMAYGAVLGRILGAEVSTVCYSGKGVYEEYSGAIDSPTHPQMGEFYGDTLTAGIGSNGQTFNGVELHQYPYPAPGAQALADDIVLINLGANDISGATHNNGGVGTLPPLEPWREAYLKLLRRVRANNPDAEIFLLQGPITKEPMRSRFQKMLVAIPELAQDSRVYVLAVSQQDVGAGFGCDWHPTSLPITLGGKTWRGGQSERMAAELAAQIRKFVPGLPSGDVDPNPLQINAP